MTVASLWRASDAVADFLFGATARGRDLTTGRHLETAVALSLFTDRLADASDPIPDGTDDRRGWWGDSGLPIARHMGARFWLLAREKRIEPTRLRFEQYAREALAWLVSERVATRVDVRAEWNARAPARLDLEVVIWKGDRRLLDRRYDLVWTEIGSGQTGVAG